MVVDTQRNHHHRTSSGLPLIESSLHYIVVSGSSSSSRLTARSPSFSRKLAEAIAVIVTIAVHVNCRAFVSFEG